jgi:ketosteroid isomerase-like protein
MNSTNEDMEQTIRKINNRFYNAFGSLSLERMEEIWKHSDDVVCVHPGWDLFAGWMAVRESWMTIFRNTASIQFLITNEKLRVFENALALVVCIENIQSNIGQNEIKMGVIATNIFERQNMANEEKWLMIHHHGSPLLNHIPPNVSI